MVSGFQWKVSPEKAFPELAEAYISAIHRGVYAIAQRRAPEIENWMKDHAPWTDRTGNARQTLYTEVTDVANQMVTIMLSHGVFYGIFLEMNNASKWGIISPALDHFAPIIWSDVQRMLS